MPSRAPLLNLPPEIWYHITQYAAPGDRLNLALVNRMLYSIVVSDLYRHVEIVNRNPRVFVHQFQTLYTNSDLRNRMQKLTVWLHALNEAVHVEDNCDISVGLRRRREHSSRWRRIVRNIVRHIKPPAIAEGHTLLHRQPHPVSPDNKIDLFKDTLTEAQNLKDLAIIWKHDYSGSNKASPATCTVFIDILWNKIGNTIHSLTLDISMFNLRRALLEWPEFGLVRELNLKISLEHHGDSFRINMSQILATTVLGFVSHLAPRLEALSITSLCNLDLDPLFTGLGPTPHLRKLSLCLATQAREMWSANGLQTFLRNRNGIQYLSIRYADCCSRRNHGRWIPHDPFLVGDEFTGSNKVDFPDLERAELGLRFFLSSPRLFPSYVSRFNRTIRSLALLDRSLTYQETECILTSFPFAKEIPLRSLSMFVEILVPELLVLIATNCPALLELSLHVERIAGGLSFTAPWGRDGFIKALKSELSAGERAVLRGWRLQSLNIFQFVHGNGEMFARDIVRSVAEVIPSVTLCDE